MFSFLKLRWTGLVASTGWVNFAIPVGLFALEHFLRLMKREQKVEPCYRDVDLNKLG